MISDRTHRRPPPEPHMPPAADLAHSLRVLRFRKWSVIITGAFVVSAALISSFQREPMFESEARVLVLPSGGDLATRVPVNLETERALVQSSAVAAIVKQDLVLSEPASALLSPLDVRVETNTEILAIGYSSGDPGTAQRLAQAFAQAYLEFRREEVLQEVQSEASAIQAKIAGAEAQLTALEGAIRAASGPATQAPLVAQRDSLLARLGVLQQQLEDLPPESSILAGGGKIVQPAGMPGAPSGPNHVRDGLLALPLGLLLGVAVALLRERLDERLRDPGDLEAHSGAPVLATVPHAKGRRNRDALVSARSPAGPPAEAYRTLRTNVQFVARKHELRVLVVTSPASGEGKTTTSANLAFMLARAGRKSVLVSCDLRKPRLHALFDLDNAVGVSTILAGEVDLAGAARGVRLPAPAGGPVLQVLPSGPVPLDPAELLASSAMESLLDQLRSLAEFVVIDTPPFLAVADALILAQRSDGVLIVADAGRTARGAIAETSDQLEQSGAHVVGTVLNNFEASRSPYHYRYHHPYQYHSRQRDPGAGWWNGQRRNGEGSSAPAGMIQVPRSSP